MIAHMKYSIQDWLANNDWDVMMVGNSNSSTKRRSILSSSNIRLIVLEPNFDLEEQIDDTLRVIATRAQIELKDSWWCPHRQHSKERADQEQQQQQQQQQYKGASSRNRRHVHSSFQQQQQKSSANSAAHDALFSEKGIRCVAQFYRRDYEIIRELSHSSACGKTSRLALESIWNRRSPLLLLK
jgi:hypothetical protein